MFKATLLGNVVRDPNLASTRSGVTVCNIDVACSMKRKDANGEHRSIFVKVTAWRGLAELCARYLKKGRKVQFIGDVDAEAYMGNDGQPKVSLLMTADDVEFIGGKMDVYDQEESQEPAGGNQYRAEPKAEQDGFIAVDMGEDDLPF